MILFYEDEKNNPSPKKKTLFGKLIKLALFLGFLVFLSLMILSTLGKYKEPLRLGIQDYMNQSTGTISEIALLEDMSFFPVTSIRFSGLSFFKPIQKSDAEVKAIEQANNVKKDTGELSPISRGNIEDVYSRGEKVAFVEKAHIAMGFWDLLLSRKRFYAVAAEGVSVEKGIWLPEKLVIHTINVDHDESRYWLSGKGRYGDHDFTFTIDILAQALRGNILRYEIADKTPFAFTFGPISAKGVMHAKKLQGLELSFEELLIDDLKLAGHLQAKRTMKGLHVSADTLIGDSNILASYDGHAGGNNSLVIKASALSIEDIQKLYKAYEIIEKVIGYKSEPKKVSFGDHNWDVKIKADKFIRKGKDLGNLEIDARVKPFEFDVHRIAGLINGGALSGKINIDATGKTALLTSGLNWRGWDYARLQDKVTGQADTHFTLKAEGDSFADLRRGLNGEIVTIAGEGTFSQSSVLYWGAGLLNAMLPKLSETDSLTMNCMVADFEVKNSKAEAQTLFMDLSDLTISGEGSIDLNDFILDLTLTPKPKEISIIDTGVSVNITGPVTNAKVLPDSFSLGKKIGGLLLGTLNPAFFALSLTDLGLNESHPCHKFMKSE
ncbi:MAG: AsmA-like C-terminal region-containing protein [Micavibrio sp.]